MFSQEWPLHRELLRQIHAAYPDLTIIAGGEHSTAMPELVLGAGVGIKYVVKGEGEMPFLELVHKLAIGESPQNVGGLAYLDADGRLVDNGLSRRVIDIDNLPGPAWHLCNVNAYFSGNWSAGIGRGRNMPILATRGCPYQCTFCSSPQMWTTRWLARDPDLLLDELADYQRDYKAENFDFYDLTAIVKKSWIVDFCRKIEERGMSFTWQLPSGTRSEAIDGEVAELLYRSGCRNLSYSPESGSAAVLARVKKRIKPGNMIESMEACHAQGINVKCNIMLGFPGETFKEVFESYRFIVRMALAGTYDLSVWAFSPYPGSELFEQFLKDGRIKVDDAYYDSLRSYADASRTKSYSENISDSTLKALRFGGLCLFYGVQWLRRPLRPFRMIWNVWRGTHESRAEMGLANLLRRGQLTTGAD